MYIYTYTYTYTCVCIYIYIYGTASMQQTELILMRSIQTSSSIQLITISLIALSTIIIIIPFHQRDSTNFTRTGQMDAKIKELEGDKGATIEEVKE